MKFSKKFNCICLSLLGSVSVSAWAQEQEGISIGQMSLLLTAGLTWGHDDNVTFAQAGKEIDSNFYVFSPGIRLEAPSDRSLFALQLSGEKGEYDDSPADDYSNWALRGSWDFDPTSRTSLGVFGELQDGHDRRGQGRSQGDLAQTLFDADEYDLKTFGGYYTYGAVGSRGRLELKASFGEREYTNNREQTQFLDRDEDDLEGTFFVRIRPKTSLLFGIGKSETGYARSLTDGTSFDSDEKRYFVGVTWDISARTSGRIDFGKLEKDFVDPTKPDYDDDFYRVGIDWQPRTYSTLSLSATKRTTEGLFLGDYVLRKDISLSWTHYWNDRFNTIVEYGVGDDSYEPTIRSDDLTYWGIEGRWQINSHFQLGVGFQEYERDSGLTEFNYDRGVWLITLEGTL